MRRYDVSRFTLDRLLWVNVVGLSSVSPSSRRAPLMGLSG